MTGDNLGFTLVGVIDLIVGSRDRAVIADFATKARSSEPLEIFNKIQLTSYSYLFWRLSDQTNARLEIRSLVKTKMPKIEIHGDPARTEVHFR